MIKIKLYIVLLAILLSSFTYAGSSLKGWVYDEENRSVPLVGVNIFWLGTTDGTISNADGSFEISKNNASSVLVFSYVGYNNDSVLIDTESELLVYLNQGARLDEVMVTQRTSSTAISKINPILTQKISSKELAKFACCNLSESFETNASVDVSYADAVSGIKQIKMLGLSGRYSQLMLENIPYIRGSETAFGLDYIPGTWMESIQVSKGTAAVKNGFESITGQINVSFQNPDNNEKAHFYFYGNEDGKLESNGGISFRVNDNWNSNILVHLASNVRKLDMNHDGFLDKPLTNTATFMSRWNYTGEKTEAKLGISYLNEKRNGGQYNYDHGNNQSLQPFYGIGIDVNRLNAFSKVGFLFNRPNTSLGWISSVNLFKRESFYGFNRLNVHQLNTYSNLMYQSFLFHTQHNYTVGISLQYDINDEWFAQNDNSLSNVGFVEWVPGIFVEYNYIPTDRFSLLLGLRNDYSSLHGNFVTPRAHAKYNIANGITMRVSAGKGYRTPSAISENTQYLATSKQFIISDNGTQEEAWNYGVSINGEIPIGKRDASITVEYFRTDFINQLIVDLDRSTQYVYFYNLEGKSYANSLQVEMLYELFNRFELTGGMRWNRVMSTINSELQEVPFQSNYKGMLSGQYRTNFDKWVFDATIQFHGSQRLPYANNQPNRRSDEYINIIAQVTKNYRYWSFYAGAENLTNFTQQNAIINPDSPFGSSFDASQIWGPLYGRMLYVGIKYKLDKRF
ncbi:MAG: TonB-dependent receptor [Marinilabiliaceae bacterium]|nr:TonB-dependent receptor [Marinilabiliaceae bacterium]